MASSLRRKHFVFFFFWQHGINCTDKIFSLKFFGKCYNIDGINIIGMEQVKWFDRNFNFSAEQNIFPSIIERLAGTPARLEEKFKTIPSPFLVLRIDNAWSIKENVGHLIDLEPLWQARLEEIIKGEQELRPADLQNRKTYLANHNDKPLEELLHSFRQIRAETVSALENIDESIVFKSALHPRLKTPMRTMDLFLFVAEHDDHHLARITELSKIFKNDPANR